MNKKLIVIHLLILIFSCTSLISQESILYKQLDTTKLYMEVYHPESMDAAKKYPAIVFYFGGGWNGGSVAQFEPHAKYFSQKGMVCFLVDYRVKSRQGTTPFESLKDAKSALRYIREHASELHVDASRIVAAGGSAGGHLAAATALVNDYNESTDNLSVSCIPSALMLFNPVIDNGPGGYGYERIGVDYPRFSPLHNIREGAPPTIFFLGTNDRLIPVETASYYKTVMEKVGSRCDLHLYEGAGHGFFNYRSFENYRSTVSKADSFLQSLGYLADKNVPATISADVIIYGGTSAAVATAVQVARMDKSVIVVCPDKHLGGLSAGGLGWTDTGNKEVIGGLAREFYHRVWKHYQEKDAWKWQLPSDYGNKGQGTLAIDGDKRTMWIFEPHVAEQVFEDLISEQNITVYRDEWLDRENGVNVRDGRIETISMMSGQRFEAKVFVDATYEGDLMASAGITYHVGREANSVYKENWNGIQTGVLHHAHWFKSDVSPYKIPGDPKSGVLPLISTEDPGTKGEGDHRVQAYCFRLCMTNHPDNRVPFPRPANYDPSQYELLGRVFKTGWREHFGKFDPIPNKKTDTNNHGPVSSDNIGKNYDYPEAGYERRKEIFAEHENYQKGLLYFMCTDSSVPDEVRSAMNEWGLAGDEFVDNNNWPHQMYIREARRMIGEYVTTEHDITGKYKTPQSIGMGSYTMDSHNVQRYIKEDGFVQNEGDIGRGVKEPYKISYGSILPKSEECKNLLVPVCVSSSHIAFGSIRMEPVFMILGQSAGTAAALALEQNVALHDLSYKKIKARLQEDGQILENPKK